MTEPTTYPQFFHDPRTGTHLRYNSATWVCTASAGQLQVQHLNPQHPHRLHGAEAVLSTEAEFRAAYDAACERLLAVGFAEVAPHTRFQRRGALPEGWFYRQDGSQVELRLHLSEQAGRLGVNWLLEDLGTIPGLAMGPTRASDPRRVPSTEQEVRQAIKRAMQALPLAASGGWYKACYAGTSSYLGPQSGQTYTIQVRTPGMFYPYCVLIQELPAASDEYLNQAAIRQAWKEPPA